MYRRNVSEHTVHVFRHRYTRPSLFASEHGYDLAGNRTHVRTTQWPFDGYDQDNDRSYLYGYDDLRRLIAADFGALDGSNQTIVNDPDIPLRRILNWSLDNLGNWSANPPAASFTRDDDLDGDGLIDAWEDVHHATNSANEIEQLVNDEGGGPVTTDFVHDIVGNLIFDGTHWYQHDAWNRLVQVNHAGTLTVTPDGVDDSFLPNGKLDPNRPPDQQPGELVTRFAYDGLGRLVRRETVRPSDGELCTERYFYDGVRRVLTRMYDPLEGGLLQGLMGGFPGGPPPVPAGWSDIEYVYGPEYVHEFAFILNPAGHPLRMTRPPR